MSAVIVMLALAAIKKQLLDGLTAWKAGIPEAAWPIVDQVATFIGTLIDGIDAAALAASLPGQVVDLIKSGHGQSSAQAGDVA